MEVLPQLLVNGIFYGAIYAMVAVGLTLVFGIQEVVNFAQGEFYMVGAYITYLVYMAQLPYPLGVLSAIVVLLVIGLIMERCAIRPLIGKAWQLPIISTLGVSIILQNGAIVLWTPNPRSLILPLARQSFEMFGVVITLQRLLVLCAALVIFFLLDRFIKKTKTGKAMRAVSQNKEACGVLGIDVARISTITFGLGASLSGFAGAIVSPILSIHPVMGLLLVLKCFAVVIMGGFGNVKGTIYAAFMLAIVESLAVGFLALEYKDLISFTILIIILLGRPEGLFGKKVGI
jgi:branched-chain amino acid transport system permease protein